MEELIEEARKRVLGSKRLVALTGAGISAESGVPTFRGKGHTPCICKRPKACMGIL